MPLVLDLHIAHDRWGSSSELVLMDTYITLMILIGHLMRLPLTKLENIALIIITIPRLVSPLCLLLLVRLGGYTVNLCAFYFYKLIGKLTASLQTQEFSLRNMTVTSSTSTTHPWTQKSATSSLRLRHYGLFRILMAHLWRPDHTLTHHTRKPLVY